MGAGPTIIVKNEFIWNPNSRPTSQFPHFHAAQTTNSIPTFQNSHTTDSVHSSKAISAPSPTLPLPLLQYFNLAKGYLGRSIWILICDGAITHYVLVSLHFHLSLFWYIHHTLEIFWQTQPIFFLSTKLITKTSKAVEHIKNKIYQNLIFNIHILFYH